jgi:hypothetical protein
MSSVPVEPQKPKLPDPYLERARERALEARQTIEALDRGLDPGAAQVEKLGKKVERLRKRHPKRRPPPREPSC